MLCTEGFDGQNADKPTKFSGKTQFPFREKNKLNQIRKSYHVHSVTSDSVSNGPIKYMHHFMVLCDNVVSIKELPFFVVGWLLLLFMGLFLQLKIK